MHTQHWTRIIGSWENDALPVGWNFGRRSEIVLETRSGEKKVTMRGRRGREREREAIRSYVYWMLRVLDWIGLPRQQNKHSKPRCGSASPCSCFKLKLHFPVYVRPVTSRSFIFSLAAASSVEREREISRL